MPTRERVTAVLTWWRGRTTLDRARVAVLCVVPVIGIVWVATRYSENWYVADEWMTLRRTLGPLHGLFSNNAGHLIVFSHGLYAVQRSVFGLDGHELPWMALSLSLAAMQVALAMLLWRLGMSALFAMLVATLVTYFGPGGQNVTWEFQWNQNAMFALCFLAAFVALGERITTRKALTVSALAVLAVGADSQLTALPMVLIAVLVVRLWPKRLAALALIPPAVAQLAWFAIGHQGPSGSASLERMWTFAHRLLLQSAAGLVGGGATGRTDAGVANEPVIPISPSILGLLVLVTAGAVVTFGIRRRRLSRSVLAGLVGGSAAALITVGVLARTRAFFYKPSLGPILGLSPDEIENPNFFGSRYVQYVAVFLAVALAPAIAATMRSRRRPPSRGTSTAVAAGLIAVFIVNLSQLGSVVRSYESMASSTKQFVAQTITLIETECGPGHRLTNGPQRLDDINVGLLRRLRDHGAFPADFGKRPSRAVRDASCRAR